MKYAVTEENTPLLLKIGIIVLVIAVFLTGFIIYMDHDNTVKIRNERDDLKIENRNIKTQFNNLSDSLVFYDKNQKELLSQIKNRNILIETLREHYKTIQNDYDKEIDDIHSDSTATAFRAINDIFRQHDSINK